MRRFFSAGNRPGVGPGVLLVVAVALLLTACKDDESDSATRARAAATGPAAPDGDAASKDATSDSSAPKSPGRHAAESEKATQAQPAEQKPAECPDGMKRIEGGAFWVGTQRETYEREENPRFRTRLPDFCADVYEVSTAEYERCVQAGECTEPELDNQTCNSVDKGKGDHPINCIDFHQASAVCEWRGGRVPTEVEWEYLARGGAEMRKYPWGDAEPDGRTCWKHAGTCERGSFEAGAFGLHDVTGNVWEWTSSWFGHYPWPELDGRHRVYRGASWSRRFEKWLRPTLRNRLDPEKTGSHLGVRCVADLPGAECPYGRNEETGHCLHGVDDADCLDGEEWNGLSCAAADAPPRCPAGSTREPGYGCVRPRIAGPVDDTLDTDAVTRARTPKFDADCKANVPGKPHAYRYTGGGHLARNVVGGRDGCKNRDVGVGWNSACCP